MSKSVRHLAADILTQIELNHDFASPLLNRILDDYQLTGNPDSRLLTHLVYGVLRLRGHLDWIILKFYRGNFINLDEQIKNILRISLFQLKFSDRIPKFAVVDEAVKIANKVNPDKSGLVNAILRNFLRQGKNTNFPSLEKNTVEYISSFHSHPLWLVKKWLLELGIQDTVALCAANNATPPLTFRVNTLKITRDKLAETLKLQGFIIAPTFFSPDGLTVSKSELPIQKTTAFSEGLLRLQDEGSQYVSHVVNPKINESILDVCAGSGGKTTHLAALTKNKGRIVAIDNNPKKISELKKESTRMGITSIQTYMADLNIHLPEELYDKFDQVLVDAPCSGTGTLRRNPEIKWRVMPDDINKFASIQQNILYNSSKAVKKGGRLIYCTCSLLPDENENIIDNFLIKNKHFSLCPLPLSANKRLFDNRNFYHTYPHIHNMDAFFATTLIRN